MSEKNGDKNKVISNEIESIQTSNNKVDNTVYTLSEALSGVDEAVIRGSVIKTYDFIEKKNAISGFNENNYFVKSYSRPNDFPRNINIDEKRLIKCDSNCPRYNADGFCSHAIAVSLQTKNLKKYACTLAKSEERNATLELLLVTDVPLILKEMGRACYHHLILSLLKSLDESTTIRE